MNLKKPKFWDYKKPNIYAYLLSPLAFIVKIINFIKKNSNKKKTKIKTICVGNIYIGGTGKTSLSIKINEILNKKKIKSCIVKKFYKNQIDEQKVLKNHSKLFLSLRRLDAIKQAESENYEIAILVLGPKEFPIALKKIGSYIGKLKNTFSSFQREISSVTSEIDSDKDIAKDEDLKKKDNLDD